MPLANKETEEDSSDRMGERTWASRLAMVAVLSLPFFAVYALRFSHEPARNPRLPHHGYLDCVHPADGDHFPAHQHRRQGSRSLAISNLNSLSRIFNGCKRSWSRRKNWFPWDNSPPARLTKSIIRSPLFSDIPTFWPTILSSTEKSRAIAAKIRDQARRTKTLVGNLLSFARQVPPERTLLDINTVVTNALHSVLWTCGRQRRVLSCNWNRFCPACAGMATN